MHFNCDCVYVLRTISCSNAMWYQQRLPGSHFCTLYSFQFLAHDTDSSGTLANREFADVFSDVWLPIEVPKVS